MLPFRQAGGCSVCVCVDTAACWQPATSWQITETGKQHSVYGFLKQLSTKGLQAHPPCFIHLTKYPEKERVGRGCVSPISQMGKCKAQHMKTSCLPTGLWPFGKCYNGAVCTKTRNRTMSYFQTKSPRYGTKPVSPSAMLMAGWSAYVCIVFLALLCRHTERQ